MHRIINSLAVAEFNKDLRAVEINFNGQGPAYLYHETMDIAMNIATIQRTNNWLFIKDDFSDISHNAFMSFVKKWSRKASDVYAKSSPNYICKVALVTKPESCLYLLAEHEWLQDSTQISENLNMKLFTERELAKKFLNNDYSNRVLIESRDY